MVTADHTLTGGLGAETIASLTSGKNLETPDQSNSGTRSIYQSLAKGLGRSA